MTGIPNLLVDPALVGGGIHQTGPHGRLDVHIDFNLLQARGLHRRLNIIVYLNPEWHADWGGRLELWDARVEHCHHALAPTLNRCVVFETSTRSFHGVSAVTCPPDTCRRSFAAYYYTKQPPAGWNGLVHSSVFRARPNERVKRYVSMPAERLSRAMRRHVRTLKQRVKRIAS